jgi:hypothetical protein
MIRPSIHIDLSSAWGLVLVLFRDVCLNLILTHSGVVTIGMGFTQSLGAFLGKTFASQFIMLS